MQKKISYEIFSEAGKRHKKQGGENEDSVNVIVNGDYLFAVVSDGAGSGPYPKLSSLLTVDAASNVCFHNPAALFIGDEAIKRMIFDIQINLGSAAMEKNCELSDMMATLIVLGVNLKNKRYIVIHVGDGLAAMKSGDSWKIVSYPENGCCKSATYFCNSSNVYAHLRARIGKLEDNAVFFVGTDGCFEGMYLTEEYIARIEQCTFKAGSDDVSYCYLCS